MAFFRTPISHMRAPFLSSTLDALALLPLASLWAVLGSSLAPHLGFSLGLLGLTLGSSWPHLGALGALLGALVSRLGTFWGSLGELEHYVGADG